MLDGKIKYNNLFIHFYLLPYKINILAFKHKITIIWLLTNYNLKIIMLCNIMDVF